MGLFCPRINIQPHALALHFFVCLLLCVLYQTPQTAYAAGRDTLSYSILPTIGYNPDLGFAAGGTINRYAWQEGYSPYKSFSDLNLLVSTKGFINIGFLHDRPDIFGTNFRTEFEVTADRKLHDHYFGVGNQTLFDNSLWQDSYYYFESISLGASVKTRHPLYNRGNNRLDLLSLGGVSYTIPYDNDGTRLIGLERPAGFSGGWVNYIGTGLMWDSRDNEFAPVRGNRSNIELYLMPHMLLSDYQMAALHAETRQYATLHFLSNTTIALRGAFEHTFGDVPYWRLPHIGGESTLRGYPQDRFRGQSALVYNLELRNWLIADEFYDIRFGMHAFTDAGRVFSSRDEWRQVFEDHKRTWGIGLALGPYNPDMILRVDYAVSTEMRRLYVGFGYVF